MTVRIITDSTCDLPESIISRLNIRVIPLYIHVGNRDYLDGIDISREEFYAQLPTYPVQPTTAVPSPSKFHAMYDAMADEGATEVLSIHISSSLSAAVDVAKTAAAETSSLPVTVLDSRQLSLGTGFLVQSAAELAQAGFPAKEILVRLEEQIKRTHVWAALDTLHYLRRSGRMNGVISTIGELIQIKPILNMYDGVSAVEKTRTRNHAVKRLEEMLRRHAPYEKLAFLHSDAPGRPESLKEAVADLLPDTNTLTEVINPALGAHLGPGVVGFAWVSKN